MMKLEINVPAYALVYGKKNLRAVLRQLGALVARKARTMIRSQKTSKPGDPPASRTGALAASIKVKPSKSGDAVSVRDTKFYALFLEAGARGGGGRRKNKNTRNRKGEITHASSRRVLEPRPFLSAALEQSRSMIESKLKASIANDIQMVKK